MITYVDSNLFISSAQTLVNTVNTVGVMGRGIASEFKALYPDMFEEYKALCERGDLAIGRLLLYRTRHKWVLNFPTKRHWRQPSRLDDIDMGLQAFRQTYAEQGITSIAFPQLGCGNGGLDWEAQVRPLMERRLASLPIDVFVHIASGATTGEGDVKEELVAGWLRGDPLSLPFHVFRQDFTAVNLDSEIEHGGGNGATGTLLGLEDENENGLELDGLYALWSRLRSFGYLVPEDVKALLAVPAESVFELLTALPYVTRAKVARLPASIGYDAGSTRTLLDAPEAQGVRIVYPFFGERTVAPSPPGEEDDEACSANRTTSQLALFSTS